ncbi:MAG TPA: hypothetical protein VFL90_07865 [Methylomirabilota bacterium]|nr:hypothetical protein [Methylomirabilota bacterium]
MQQVPGGDQAGLQRLDGEAIERAREVEAGDQRGDGDKADERENELDGDAAGDQMRQPREETGRALSRRRQGP